MMSNAFESKSIYLSLAAFPTFTFVEAMQRAYQGVSEPLIGTLSIGQTQLCPQNRGVLDQEMAEGLMEAFPLTQFRLHANTRVLGTRFVQDLSDFDQTPDFWHALAKISKVLQAPCYTAHAGVRQGLSLQDVFDNAKRCADLFGIPVGIEGHYPTKKNVFHIDSWMEYGQLYLSGIPYVMDLSHIHILAVLSGQKNESLVREMLSSDRCLEVHISSNDGTHDQHKLMEQVPWWWELLDYANPAASIFSEGQQPRH